MAANIKVVLFEDMAQTRSEILGALKRHLGEEGEVIPFDSREFEETPGDKERTYEDRLENILRKPPYDAVTLLVVDRDLSKSVDSDFRGLSDNAVVAVSKRLVVPICCYAREPQFDDYEWRARWEEGHIILSLSEGEDELARQATLAARGFAEIAGKLPGAMADKANHSPAKILAALLGKPEYVEKMALYSVGDQNRLLEIPAEAEQAAKRLRRMTRFLGYWLWDSLLRYPGLLVNEVAAASYLNIAAADFRERDVQAIFEQALYQGPFADSRKPQWWRGVLDNMVSSEDCADGLELVRKRVGLAINPSQCCVDPSKPAGYYCIISRHPVSLENSKGGLSWFPRGADLTRISRPKFEEYEPWLGG
jgi:hypothetical protein